MLPPVRSPMLPPFRRWSVAVLVAALLLPPSAVTLAQSGVNLPSLGDGAGMSIAAERRLGDSIARDLYRDPDYLDDPVLVDYLQTLWQPLLGAARARGDVPPELSDRLAWQLLISRDKRVNAFALPGGYLGVHLGLVAATETSPELASVLAHELSHVSQRHIARMLSKQDQAAPWLMGALILGVLAARANVDVANAAIAGSQAVAIQNQLNFSRDMEREADRVGFGVLTGAGFEPLGFVTMFEKLQQAARLNDDGSFPYLRSHPLTSERMADMRARVPLAEAPPSGPRVGAPVAGPAATPPKALHSLMAARARVLSENGPDRQRAWLQAGQAPNAAPAAQYAAALSAHRLGQSAQALSIARQARVAAAPGTQGTWDLLQLEILAGPHARSLNDASLVTLRDQALAGSTRADLLLGAQAALASPGALAGAAARLQAWVVAQPKDAQAWQTLSRVQAALGQRLRSVRSEAEARAAQMDYAGAADRLRAAQMLPPAERNADPMELAIVDVRRREVEELLRESARQE
ncbi:M48 family metalloprotease [Hydrogenophaga pseudoflava]|uniref:M48 family metalloprotease n=1 Tax=Hydrogenophaga pseudoflava TaxID=47421 RepID=UPI0027E528B1|nr:M48 family metalloprotease [Hydrogenophaga pseudoflava]MDQ7747001.1 M48 family metalloprotease [Hydrogenophaga pseudoflava]